MQPWEAFMQQDEATINEQKEVQVSPMVALKTGLRIKASLSMTDTCTLRVACSMPEEQGHVGAKSADLLCLQALDLASCQYCPLLVP